jgi:hypothetical protein
MQLFPTTPNRAHQICRLQYTEVLRGGLPGHVQVFAKLAERLPVLLTKKVKQLSAGRVAQRFENLVSVHRSHSNVGTQYAGNNLHVKRRYSPACKRQLSQHHSYGVIVAGGKRDARLLKAQLVKMGLISTEHRGAGLGLVVKRPIPGAKNRARVVAIWAAPLCVFQ